MNRHRLGQHYLVDPRVIRRMVELADIKGEDKVLEIGTGRGALTTELARSAGSLEAYEVDRENYVATKRVASSINLHLNDAFKSKPTFDVLVSSLPYSESSSFIEWLSMMKYDRAIVLLQKDFVSKITAESGTRNYRALSALAQLSAEIVPKDRVGRNSFVPAPRVDSQIVLFRPRRRLNVREVSALKSVFSLRRRTLASVANALGFDAAVIGGYDGGLRVFSLSPDQAYQLVTRWLAAAGS